MVHASSTEPLLDVREAAERLSVPVRFVYVLAERGDLRYYKVGRLLRFDPQHLREFLEANAADSSNR